MSQKQSLNLKDVERKAWQSAFADGLWDIYLGMLLASSAVSQFLSESGVADGVRIPIYTSIMLLGGVLLWAGKKWISAPRTGRVKYGPAGQARKMRVTVITLIAVLMTGALFAAVLVIREPRPAWLESRFLVPAMISLGMLVGFWLAAGFLDFRRLYVIGVMFALGEPLLYLTERLGIGAWLIAFGIPALIVLGMGLVVLAQFLRTNPPLALPPDEGIGSLTANGEQRAGGM